MEQFDDNGIREFLDDEVREFLLGGLTPSRQDLFEQQLLTDDALEARVSLLEGDLADAYAFGQLSAADQTRFEERFLLTSDRLKTLNVSIALRDRFSSVAHAAKSAALSRVTFVDRLKYLLGLERAVWRIAFGALILAILFATAVLVIKEPRLAVQITNKIIPRRSPPTGAPRSASHPTNTSMPDHQNVSSPMPPHDQSRSPVVLSLALTPSQTGEMPSTDLPKGEQDVVRLKLALPTDQTGPFRAELVTGEGSSVFSADSLTPNSSEGIDFDVPARLLKSGDYQVKLSQVGSSDLLAGYYFRVQ